MDRGVRPGFAGLLFHGYHLQPRHAIFRIFGHCKLGLAGVGAE